MFVVSHGASAEPAAKPLPAELASYKVLRNLDYAGTDNPRQKLDLLLPQDQTDTPRPVIVYIHGGAWLGGDKRHASNHLSRLLKVTGSPRYAFASIGYRLSGEAIWPAQIHDCKAGIRWIRANAEKYNLDPDRIAVWGPSAGGHLVAMLGTSGDDKAMEGDVGPHTTTSSRVTCVANFFGPTDFLQMGGSHNDADSPESRLVGGAIQEHVEEVATANPITYVSKDDPPFLTVHGTQDRLVPYSQVVLLHEALERSDLDSTLITVNEGGHGRGFGEPVFKLLSQFFAHHLHGEEVPCKSRTIQATVKSN